MKKNYTTPDFRVYNVRRTNVICTSDSSSSIQSAGSNKGASGNKVAESNSRGGGIWD